MVFAEIGGFGGPGIPDSVARTHFREGMAIAKSYKMDLAFRNCGFKLGNRNHIFRFFIGSKYVNNTMPHTDTLYTPCRRKRIEQINNWVAVRPFRQPRGAYQFETLTHLNRCRVLDDVDMSRFLFYESAGAVNGSRIQRVMITGKEINRDRHLFECFDCPCDGFTVHLV